MERDRQGLNPEQDARRREQRFYRGFITYLGDKALVQQQTTQRVMQDIQATGICELSTTLRRLDNIASKRKRLQDSDRERMRRLMAELDLQIGFQNIEAVYNSWRMKQDEFKKPEAQQIQAEE